MTRYPVFMTKKCFICEQWKPIESFYVHSQMTDGHLNKCKECTKAYTRSRQGLPEVMAYDRERGKLPHRRAKCKSYSRTERGRERLRTAKADWAKRNPDKIKASGVVNNAIRGGKIVSEGCEVCGEKAHAHHEDYSKPLEVKWLCPRHHSELHATRRVLAFNQKTP